MLMEYLVRYRLSRSLSLLQGKELQVKQNFPSGPSGARSQVTILQETQYFGFPSSGPRHPGHWSFFLDIAMQRAQSIPQGAIIALSMISGVLFSYFINGDSGSCVYVSSANLLKFSRDLIR